MIGWLAVVVSAYLLGSVNGSLLVGRLRGGVDIRDPGSGNAGGTNALRTQGGRFALAVIVIDIGKGWIATRLPVLAELASGGRGGDGAVLQLWWPASCAFAAILGHVYPLWHGFRGGKGAATVVGALAGLAPVLLLPLIGTWLACVMLSGFVGLATIVSVVVLPVAVGILGSQPFFPLLGFALAVAAFVSFTHRGNVSRMRAGTEPRARRLWLLRP
ncbi:MAG: glycerol-3-phosphate 1-O-acyltransferase PlsY [Gammaproteobacteria bacterium]|nr:glycerol-3-phosphate 1-O-acyltransferase PlsY [Gammaproteobacteria bacterium]